MYSKFDKTNYKTRYEAKDLKGDVEARIMALAELTDTAALSEAVSQYLETMARFHNYSLWNTMAIIIQNPNASVVAGFKKWMTMGRFVKKGEKGIAILAPIFAKKEDKTGKEVSALVGFKTVYVFDISQTDGKPLPEAPEWKSPEKDAELEAALVKVMNANNINFQVVDVIRGDAQGVSKGGTIHVIKEAGTKTFIHELAHEFLHQGNKTEEWKLDKKTVELEAEAVGYVVASHFGLDDLSSPNYIALFQNAGKDIIARLDRISDTAQTIINQAYAALGLATASAE